MTAIRGVALLYLSLAAALCLGLLTSSINTRLLSIEEFGRFRFAISALTISSTVSTFGCFATTGLLLVRHKSRRSEKLIMSSALGYACLVCWLNILVCTILLAESAFWTNGSAFAGLFIVVLAGSMLLPLMLNEAFRAKARFGRLALLNVLPSLCYLAILGGVYLAGLEVTYISCLAIFMLSQFLSAITVMGVAWQPSKFRLVNLAVLLRINRGLGLSVYWATLLGTVAANVGIFALQSTSTIADVAKFSLGLTLAAPLAMLPSAIGTAYFARLAGTREFPPLVLLASWIGSITVLIFFIFLLPHVIEILYGSDYQDVLNVAIYCSVASVLHGIGDIYNRYYLANRQTKLLFRIVVGVTAVAVIGSYSLSAMYGSSGASVARIGYSGTYVALLLYLYHVRSLRF